MTDDTPNERKRIEYHYKFLEVKNGIARLIEPHASAAPESVGLVILALLELAIERHLEMFPDEIGARILLDRTLRKILDRRAAGHGD